MLIEKNRSKASDILKTTAGGVFSNKTMPVNRLTEIDHEEQF